MLLKSTQANPVRDIFTALSAYNDRMQTTWKRSLPSMTLAAFMLLAGYSATAMQSAPAAPAATPDYAKAESWVCRPGAEDICTTGLDALATGADGKSTVEHFEAAKNPAIDCFYVYPTVSLEQTPLSDMTDSPEIQRTVKAQVGRLSSRCRVYAPIYRQATMFALRQSMTGAGTMDFKTPMQDVEAAWDYYLKHDNKGRGVVLVGHSQGTILLQQLIAKSIDGTPAQELLVSAFLAGDPSLGVPKGKDVGGTFKHVPVCSAAAQTGCVYVWGTFMADDASPNHLFGRARNDGMVSACENPAAPSGGSSELKSYFEKPRTAPVSDPPWVKLAQYSGSCKADAKGNAFYVTADAGPMAERYTALLKLSELRAGWGLHVRDIPLVQGNMLDVLDAELAAWSKSH